MSSNILHLLLVEDDNEQRFAEMDKSSEQTARTAEAHRQFGGEPDLGLMDVTLLSL